MQVLPLWNARQGIMHSVRAERSAREMGSAELSRQFIGERIGAKWLVSLLFRPVVFVEKRRISLRAPRRGEGFG